MRLMIAAVTLFSFISLLATAEQVALKNGDRLTGTVLSMDGKKLLLKTTYAGDISIEMASVESFSSAQPMVVTRTDNKTVTGTVMVEDSDYVVTTASGPQVFARSESVVMRSSADQAAYEKSLHPSMLQGWKGGGNFGLAFARGNSQSTNLALGFDAQRKNTSDAWTLSAASIYSTDDHLSVATANSLQAMIRYDRNLNKWLFIFGTFAGGYDDLQNLNYRILPGGGLGLHAIATPRTTLDLLAGMGYTRESYSTGLVRNLTSGTFGNEFSFKLSSRSTLMQNLYYLPSFNETSNYRIVGNIGISTKLNGWMTANLLFNDRYNSQPVLGNKKNDVLFTSGLGFTFGKK
jgi:putative salt-induced outer membrane protein YdiY